MGIFKKLLSSTKNSSSVENVSLNRLIPKCKEWKKDTILITTSKNCSLCKNYNRKIYSLYGWNKKYPRLPEMLLKNNCPECKKSIGVTMYL